MKKFISIFLLFSTLMCFDVYAVRNTEYGMHLPDPIADFREDFESDLTNWNVAIDNGSQWGIADNGGDHYLTSGPVDTWGADKETLIVMNQSISAEKFSFSVDVSDKRYGAMASLVFKYTSPLHYYSLRMLNIDDVDYIGFYRRNGVTLWEEENLTLVKFPGSIRTPQATFEIKVEVFNNTFRGYVNGELVTEYTEEKEYFSGDQVGIFQSYGEPSYDNVEIFYLDLVERDIEFEYNRKLLNDLGFLWDVNHAKDGDDLLTGEQFDYFMSKFCFAPKGNNDSEVIDVEQVLESFLRALGYDKIKSSTAYYNARNDLTDNITTDFGNINLRDFMRMAVNSFEIPLVRQKYGDKETYTVEDEKTILGEYHDIYCDESVLFDNGMTSLDGTKVAQKGWVVFENGFLAKVGNTNASEYLGYSMRYYYRDGIDPELLYIRLDTTDELFLFCDEVISFQNNVLTFRRRGEKNNSKEKISESVRCVYNGKYVSAVRESMFTSDSGDVTLVKNGRTSTLIINSYEDLVVETISEDDEMIYDRLTNERKTWKNVKDVRFYNSSYDEISCENVFEGDVVSLAKSFDGKTCTFIVSRNKATGVVEEVDIDNHYVVISGETYRLSKSFLNNSFVAPGDKGTLYLNMDDGGVYFKHDGEVSYTVAYLIASAPAEGLDGRVRIQLFDGELKVLPCSKTLKINDDVYRNNSFFNIVNSYQDIFEYRLNSKGEVSYIGIPREGYDSYNGGGLTEMGRFVGGTYYKSDTRSFSGFLLADEKVKVFLVPLDRTRTDEYAMVDISYFKNDVMYYSLAGYSHGGNAETAEYIVSEFDTHPQYQLNPACLLQGVTDYLTDDGRYTKKITVRYDENDVRQIVLGERCTLEGARIGDVIQYSENLKGEVHAILRVFDSENARLFHYGDTYYTASYRMVYGTVHELRKNSFIFERADTGREIVTVGCPILIYDTAGRETVVSSGSYVDVKDVLHFGADADEMLIRFEYGVPMQIIIYR